MEKKINNIIYLISGLLVLIILFLCVFKTYSWFEAQKDVNITNEDNCLVMSSGNLEISVDGVNYYNSINLNILDEMMDCTSNGIDFYYPISLDEFDNVPMNDPDNLVYLDKSESEYSNYVKEFFINFRTTEPMEVYLSDLSYVSARENISGNNIERVSRYSSVPFSEDGIAGAIRVAFIEEVDEYVLLTNLNNEHVFNITSGEEIVDFNIANNICELFISDGNVITIKFEDDEAIDDVFLRYRKKEVVKNLWIPNDKYELSYAIDGANFSTNGSREVFLDGNPYGYLKKSNNIIEKVPFTSLDYLNYVTVGSNLLHKYSGYYLINDAKPLLKFNNSNTLVTKKLIVRIWFEGTDRECDKAVGHGEVKYQLSFSGINKLSNYYLYGNRDDISVLLSTDDIIRKTGDTFTSFNDLIEYNVYHNQNLEFSYNGIDIFDINDVNFNLEYVYVRIKETEIKKASNFAKVYLNG